MIRAGWRLCPWPFAFRATVPKNQTFPPPAICAGTWRDRVLQSLPEIELTVLVGGYAQGYHLGGRAPVTQRVAAWREHAPRVFPLPHPSWRNTGWLKQNPWFEAELLPVLRGRVKELMR